MSRPDRRTFVKRMAATAGAAAAGSLVPGTGVGEELGRWVAGLGLSWARTPCILCDVGCGLLVGLENGRATAVRGDPDAEVNRGLACAKGYHSVQALYGRDRLARARVRRGDRLVEVPVAEALDLVAAALRETVAAHGKDSIGLYGSGHWSIPAAYAGAKLFKGGLGTNNVDSEGRLTSGSAMAGARTTFGLDGSVGCFEDIEHADVFVLWNTNLAEAHPVLFSRMLEQRQRRPGVRIIDVATRTTRTSYASDRSLLFAPRTDLALANAVAAEIVARDRASGNFLARHVSFRKEERGRGRDPGDAAPIPGVGAPATFEDYARFLHEYMPDEVERITGMAASDIRWLASLYAEPGLRVMTLWDGSVDGQIRGTWLNNALHNLHLLVGKIATPGSGPLALAAGASTCGAAGAGGLAERLPGGFVTAAEDRERTARIWGVPADRIDPAPGRHALALFHGLDTGDVRFLWIQGADPLASLPNLARYRAAAVREGRFLVVSDVYPTATTAAADVVLPSALWIEAEGLIVSPERRIQRFGTLVPPPGEAMGEAWQLIEVARRLGLGDLFPWDAATHVAGLWAEYSRFRSAPDAALPPLARLASVPGALWPSVEGTETRRRYATAEDPAADRAHGDVDFYGHADHRARIWLRPYEAPAEAPDTDFPLWLTIGPVLEHSGTGVLTRRIPTLHRAAPRAYAEIHPEDAAAAGVRNGDAVRVVSRRGALVLEARIDHRSQPPRGNVFVPSFDGSNPVTVLTLDATCPLSGQPGHDCAVRVEAATGGRAP